MPEPVFVADLLAGRVQRVAQRQGVEVPGHVLGCGRVSLITGGPTPGCRVLSLCFPHALCPACQEEQGVH